MDDLLMVSNPYWKINTILMKITGLWPLQKKYVKIPLRITVIAFIHALMIPQVIRGIKEWGKNSLIVIETVAGFFVTISPIIKYISAIVAETKLQYLYKQIMQDWRMLNEVGEQKILCEVGQMGRMLTIGYTVYMYVTGIVFSFAPGLVPLALDYLVPKNVSRIKNLCIFGEFFIDQQAYYYQLVLLTTFCVMSIISTYTTVDTTYTCCVQHIVGLFNIVDYHLNKAFHVARNMNKYDLTEAKMKIHNHVLYSLKIHKKSIAFCDLLQATFTMSFFLTMGTTLLCLSIGTVAVMLNKDNYADFFRLTCIWIGIIIYLFFVNVPGQKLIDASSSIFNSAYFCGWYAFPLQTQRLLKFMMVRSKKPCRFTAGPLLTMNLETCGVILRSSMSYFTFIIAVS